MQEANISFAGVVTNTTLQPSLLLKGNRASRQLMVMMNALFAHVDSVEGRISSLVVSEAVFDKTIGYHTVGSDLELHYFSR